MTPSVVLPSGRLSTVVALAILGCVYALRFGTAAGGVVLTTTTDLLLPLILSVWVGVLSRWVR
ncbi:hypothetical protein [Haloarcula laminariae]|uniref:hypothetical protein n=1 Tax=Haloarcula laminariae TaxID=2961577 RepID=UPI0021CA161B|nr:hypothetical protein [Halomicroarcula laminariae]